MLLGALLPANDDLSHPQILEFQSGMKANAPNEQAARFAETGYTYAAITTELLRRTGKDLTRERFLELKEAGELLEASEVYDNWYGTPRGQVRDALVTGTHVILKIEVQGAQVVKERSSDAPLIFGAPPSPAAVVTPPNGRAPASPASQNTRFQTADCVKPTAFQATWARL